MLNLLAISYWNIGPFKNKTLTLFFEEWNYLIKAPIWTWKSFLFFDGPCFALYKTSSRNILNIQSKTWFVKLLFEVDWQTYFVTRFLKQWKSKDSTESFLYSTPIDWKEILWKIPHDDILVEGIDIENNLKSWEYQLEAISFKNEKDLQQSLNAILPPQEVFLSTIFLLQDAPNVFEMQPAERLEVLKNVFWLLWIDESKELLKDKKKEIKGKMAASQWHIDNFNEKLHKYLENILREFSILQENLITKNCVSLAEQFFSEIEWFWEKLSINNFALPEETTQILPEVEKKLDEEQGKYNQIRTEISVLDNQKKSINIEIDEVENNIFVSNQRCEKIDQLFKEFDLNTLQVLKNQKKELQNKQNELEQQVEVDRIEKFYEVNRASLQLGERNQFSLLEVRDFVQELITLGINLKKNSELLSKNLQNEKEKINISIESLENQIKNYEEKKSFYDNQKKIIEEKINTYEDQTLSSEKFSCEKIQWDCPFIRVINKQYFEEREKWKRELLNQKEELNQRIKENDFETKISNLKEEIIKLKSPEYISEESIKIKELLQENEKNMELVRNFLQEIDYKKIERIYWDRKLNTWEIQKLEKSIEQQEILQQKQEELKQEKLQLESKIQELKIQKEKLSAQILQLEEQIKEKNVLLQNEPKEELQQWKNAYQNYSQNIILINNLCWDYWKFQLEEKQLEEEEKMITILYWVLSKELLLYVLWEYLPSLSDIINNYLSSVVDYQISIKLNENLEKLELETKILDEKWERDVKSLSGGQRTILKLVWMLAISSYLRTEMLFLDETVNNLDGETVWKVTQLLDNFVKQRRMKFYTITHNSEIQWMSIWDKIIEISGK